MLISRPVHVLHSQILEVVFDKSIILGLSIDILVVRVFFQKSEDVRLALVGKFHLNIDPH